jgi:hypothetical protein
MFSLELLQAVNDWQIGGSALKATRAQNLKAHASSLPDRYRTVHVPCYRRIDLPGAALNTLGGQQQLSEAISSWSTVQSVAWTLHNGIPDQSERLLPYVFSIVPEPSSVVLSIEALYADPDFRGAIELNRRAIRDISDGIDTWGDTEHEVLLEVSSVSLDSVCSQGGYSSSPARLDQYLRQVLTKLGGTPPTEDQFLAIRDTCIAQGIYDIKHWITSPEAIERLKERLVEHAH